MLIERKYECETAHQLTAGVPEGHQCRRLHGHRYEITVSITGGTLVDGMVIEYADIDSVVDPLIKLIDHHCLNFLGEDVCISLVNVKAGDDEDDVVGKLLEVTPTGFEFRAGDLAEAVRSNPTVENLANWLYEEIGWRFNHAPKATGLKTGPVLYGVSIREDSRSLISR